MGARDQAKLHQSASEGPFATNGADFYRDIDCGLCEIHLLQLTFIVSWVKRNLGRANAKP